jgi:hypothetical protein
MEIVIEPHPNTDKPTIIFGFTDEDFSQCVYIRVDTDPLKVLEMGNAIIDKFVAASAAAVKAHKEAKLYKYNKSKGKS